MPMSVLFNRLGRDQRGVSAVELAMMLPVILLLILLFLEAGRVYSQMNMMERGVRSGALFAARHDFPLSDAVKTDVENLVKRGTTDSSAPYLVEGWHEAGATYQLLVSDFAIGTETVPVVRVAATVPFEPLMPGLANLIRILLNQAGADLGESWTIRVSHDQSQIDD